MTAVGLAVVPGLAVAVVGDLSAETMADHLVAARGRTILTQVERRLDTTRRSKEAFAQLLAADPAVVAATAAGDPAALAQTLVPARSRLDIHEIDVLDRYGTELLHLSPRDDRHILEDLATQARAGITTSRAELVSGGLLVQAASPIKDASGLIGIVVTGRHYDATTLPDLVGGDDILLALYHDGRFAYLPDQVASVLDNRSSVPETGSVVEHYLSTPLELAPGDTLLALVDITDIFEARTQRRLIVLVGGGILALVAAVLGLAATRRLTQPLRRITSVARSIAEGEYDKRVATHLFTEIDTVGAAINQLAEAVQTRIDQLSSAEAEIRHSLQSKDQLVASVSHELRTPLTAVVGYAQMLDDPDAELSDTDRVDMIHHIATESIDLANIIEDLLVASRAETGQLTVSTRPVDITLQIRQVLDTLSEEAVGKTIQHHLTPVEALGDPGRIRQILRNLLANAIRHGGDTITITSAGTRDGHIQIAVTDDGPLIPPGVQGRIFEPYQRAHHRPGVTASVGLGLTISRQLARLMNGDLTYHPTGGNTFTVTLPGAPLPAIETHQGP